MKIRNLVICTFSSWYSSICLLLLLNSAMMIVICATVQSKIGTYIYEL